VIGRAHVCDPHPEKKRISKAAALQTCLLPLLCFALLCMNEREVPRKAMAKLNSKGYDKTQLQRLRQNSTPKATAKLNSKGYGKTQLQRLRQNSTQKATAKLNSKGYGKTQLKRLRQNSTQKATAKLNSLQLLLHELFLGDVA
jgi:hypothetical protein